MSPAPMIDETSSSAQYAGDSTVAALLARQAARTPDAAAVIVCDRTVTYRELDERSDQLAQYLQRLGVKPDTLVGVAMGRSEELIISLFAVLKSGGAYVPLDPHYPLERLSWIIEDSCMPVLLTTAKTCERLAPVCSAAKLIAVDDLALSSPGTQRVRASSVGRDLAYVIYTSGSTGKPKGVMVENRNVVNFFAAMDRAIGCEPGVWLAVTSISFDISVLELLWTLTRGFRVVLHGDEGTDAIPDEILRHHVTHLQMTPSLALILMLDPRSLAALGSLKQILLGGEAVPASLVRTLRRVFHGEIYDMYGPTETTIWSTCGRIDEIGSTISIGKPVLHTQILILGPDQKPVTPGETGELFIAGDGVARGYWNRPELTAARFLAIPPLCDSRLYRTGDLARYRPNGDIEFLGRADYQIKLRGHRIEPGEIEAALEECSGIRRAVVVVREDREGDKRLVAYLAGETQSAEGLADLRRALEAKLPEFMIPSHLVFLPELPLTDNGKIDRNALLKLPPPIPHATRSGPVEDQPATQLEQIIADAWKDALGLSTVGLHENFFDLGAHSLTIAEVHAKLQESLRQEFDLIDLFQFSTVSALAAHLAGAQARDNPAERAHRRRLAIQR
ncbi:MAG: non-ribosomal peptide synthetase [Terracidiphilus sp.]